MLTSEPFNNLTSSQTERLAILAEEAGEVIQVVGKILRHGFDSTNPFDISATPNRKLLALEMGQLRLAIDRLIDNADVSDADVDTAYQNKMASAAQWLHHNKN